VRRGILGGSFDPVHFGHLKAATAVADRLQLGAVHFVPAKEQPFKVGRHGVSVEHRVAMLQTVMDFDPRFRVDLRETEREGPSHTVDTLRSLRADYPGDALFLLVGADAARDLPAWREAGEVGRLATVVVMTRPGAAVPEHELVHRVVEVPAIEISATEVRERVARGEPIQGLVPEVVARYIETHGLYRAED
jgi:nicotinate-nucleotide adenylyltransferase